MTREASHVAIAMGQLIIVAGNVAPSGAVFANRFCVTRLLAVVARARRDGVHGLHDPPPAAGHDHRVLNDIALIQQHVPAIFIRPLDVVVSNHFEQRHFIIVFVAHLNPLQIIANHRFFIVCADHPLKTLVLLGSFYQLIGLLPLHYVP